MRAAAVALVLFVSAAAQAPQTEITATGERHLANVRQITFGGENAEAYFSADGRALILQSAGKDVPCDQIFRLELNADGSPAGPPRRISNGRGKTTCSYFFPDGKRVLYSSTHLAGPQCPPRPDYSRGYVWPIYSTYDIFVADADGSRPRQLTKSPGYDAEATLSYDGKKIVFTSMRSGDLEIYTMDANGKNVRRLTTELGYDGGPVFSPDGKRVVFRAHRPANEHEAKDYQALLKDGLIRPGRLEIWVMDADGKNKRQVTSNGAANFGPFWHPEGKRIIFSSNMKDPKSRNFDLYMINDDGSGLEQITHHTEFDGFPMFTRDGRRLVWASNRGGKERGETNIFLADWVE
jgi:TolB protein